MDEAGSTPTLGGDSLLDQLDGKTAPRKKRAKLDIPMPVPATTQRTYRHDSVYKQEIVKYLDKLAVDGFVIEAITNGIDIRGFEVVSYKDEVQG